MISDQHLDSRMNLLFYLILLLLNILKLFFHELFYKAQACIPLGIVDHSLKTPALVNFVNF